MYGFIMIVEAHKTEKNYIKKKIEEKNVMRFLPKLRAIN